MTTPRSILCFGDSNTWGATPGTGIRYDRGIRWTGILQARLGSSAYVIEEGLSGRTTAFEDPFAPKKNGLEYLPVSLQTHAPIDLCMVMLGTNDLKTVFNVDPFVIGQGCFRLLEAIKLSGSTAQVLLICPALVVPTEDVYIQASFKDAVSRSQRLPAIYKTVAEQHGCHFLNAGDVCTSSSIDGIHLDQKAHALLGNAIADRCAEILGIIPGHLSDH